MIARDRSTLAQFVYDVTKAYPDVGMPELMTLMLAARKLRSNRTDLDEIKAELASTVAVPWSMCEKDGEPPRLYVVVEPEPDRIEYLAVAAV